MVYRSLKMVVCSFRELDKLSCSSFSEVNLSLLQVELIEIS